MGRPLTALRSEPLEDRPLTNPTSGIGGCCARSFPSDLKITGKSFFDSSNARSTSGGGPGVRPVKEALAGYLQVAGEGARAAAADTAGRVRQRPVFQWLRA